MPDSGVPEPGASMNKGVALPRKENKYMAKRQASGEVGKLTRREQEALELLALGMDNQSIAEKLNLSAKTVEMHLTSLYAKLEARGRVEAVLWYWSHRLDC